MVIITTNFNTFPEIPILGVVFSGFGDEYEYTTNNIFRKKNPPPCPICDNKMVHNGFNLYTKKGMGGAGVCGAAVLLVAIGIIRTAKQLPEVTRTAVWGRAALCLAGASCDWLGGNIEKLIIPGCRIHMLSGSGCSGCMAPSGIIPG